MSGNGELIYIFTNYLVKYLQSIDPDFQPQEIIQAMYVTAGTEEDWHAGASIETRTPEASSKIKELLHDRDVNDIFPGIKKCDSKRIFDL